MTTVAAWRSRPSIGIQKIIGLHTFTATNKKIWIGEKYFVILREKRRTLTRIIVAFEATYVIGLLTLD